jgi:hypothetical protein
MKKPSQDSIAEATKRVMDRLPLDKIRSIPKYKDITEEDYFLLIKNAEKFAILIFETYIAGTNSNGGAGFK